MGGFDTHDNELLVSLGGLSVFRCLCGCRSFGRIRGSEH